MRTDWPSGDEQNHIRQTCLRSQHIVRYLCASISMTHTFIWCIQKKTWLDEYTAAFVNCAIANCSCKTILSCELASSSVESLCVCVCCSHHIQVIEHTHTRIRTHTYVVAAIRRWCRISVLGRSIAAYPSHCYHQPYGYRKLYIPLISNADFWKCTEQKDGYTDSNFSLHIQRIGSRRKVAMVSFSPEFIRTRQILRVLCKWNRQYDCHFGTLTHVNAFAYFVAVITIW